MKVKEIKTIDLDLSVDADDVDVASQMAKNVGMILSALGFDAHCIALVIINDDIVQLGSSSKVSRSGNHRDVQVINSIRSAISQVMGSDGTHRDYVAEDESLS